jgi:hypothetical protein
MSARSLFEQATNCREILSILEKKTCYVKILSDTWRFNCEIVYNSNYFTGVSFIQLSCLTKKISLVLFSDL